MKNHRPRQLPRRFLLLSLVLSQVISGCLQGGDEFKEWAKETGPIKNREFIQMDASSRSYRVFGTHLEQSYKSINRLQERAAPVAAQVVKALTLTDLTQSAQPTREQFRVIWNLYVREGQTLIAAFRESQKILTELEALYTVCQDMGEKYAPPPIDVSALVGAYGEQNYVIGVGIVASSEGVKGDINQAYASLFTAIFNLLDRYVFNRQEYKDYAEGVEILKRNVPDLKTRVRYFKETCEAVRQEYFFNGQGQGDAALQSAQALVDQYYRLSVLLARSAYYLYLGLTGEALTQAVREFGDASAEFELLQDYLTDKATFERIFLALDDAYDNLRLSSLAQNCKDVLIWDHKFKTVTSQFNELTKTAQAKEISGTVIEFYFKKRCHHIKNYNTFAESFGKKCGLTERLALPEGCQ